MRKVSITTRLTVLFAGASASVLLGLGILISEPSGQKHEIKGKRILGAYASAFLLTLANPATILFFMAAFSAIKVPVVNENRLWILLLVTGTFLGSSIWWLVLSSGATLLEHRISRNLRLFNTVAGAVIIFIGLLQILPQ